MPNLNRNIFSLSKDKRFAIVTGILILVVCVAVFSSFAEAAVDSEVGMILNSFSFMVWGAFVMWMCAGFCMLESGSVRSKNVSLICLKNIGLYAIAGLTYYVIGYNLMYVDVNGFIGSVEFLYKPTIENTTVADGNGETIAEALSPHHSPMSFWLFQMVFLTTSLSIVSGTLTERVKIWPFFAFAILHAIFIYPVVGAWAWGGGWLYQLGFKDFAGSTVVHATGGACALAGALVVGARVGKFRKDGSVRRFPPSSIPVFTLGVFILWIGWFGFNGGSQASLGSVNSAVAMSIIIVNTNLAASAGMLVTLALSRPLIGRVDLSAVLNGTIAGLVAISAGPDILDHNLAILIGGVGGLVSLVGTKFLEHLKIDDGVGAIPVHLFAGIWGTIAVCFSQQGAVFVQLIGILSICAYAFTAAFIIWNVIDILVGARSTLESERIGLDWAVLKIQSYPEFLAMPEPHDDD